MPLKLKHILLVEEKCCFIRLVPWGCGRLGGRKGSWSRWWWWCCVWYNVSFKKLVHRALWLLPLAAFVAVGRTTWMSPESCLPSWTVVRGVYESISVVYPTEVGGGLWNYHTKLQKKQRLGRRGWCPKVSHKSLECNASGNPKRFPEEHNALPADKYMWKFKACSVEV